MIKKSIILIFCALFLLSTTGLPLTLHFCKMKSADKKCSMCMKHVNHKNSPEFKRDISGCCKTTLIKTEIKDNFISSKSEETSLDYNLIAILFAPISVTIYNNTSKFTDTSPPMNKSGSVYILNSVLII